MKRTAELTRTGFKRPLERTATASLSVPVMRKCKVTTCRTMFAKRSMTHVACSPECAQIVAAAKREKEARAAARVEAADTRAKKEAMKSRGQWLKEAQTAFNAWIRARDAHRTCISCGRDHQGQWHAGHYLSTGARPELRFDEANCHKQCQPCNTHLHGNLVLYRAELVHRYGLPEVERLEGPHEPRKYSADELRALRDTYRALARALKKQQPATL